MYLFKTTNLTNLTNLQIGVANLFYDFFRTRIGTNGHEWLFRQKPHAASRAAAPKSHRGSNWLRRADGSCNSWLKILTIVELSKKQTKIPQKHRMKRAHS